MLHRRIERRALAALTAAGACALAGCGADLNTANTIGGHPLIDTVTPGGEQPPLASEAPSLRSIGRENWARRAVVSPVDPVLHQPTYTFDEWALRRGQTRRAEGLWPTADSALDVEGDAGEHATWLLLDPLVAGAEIAAFPVRVFLTPPWDTLGTPIPAAGAARP